MTNEQAMNNRRQLISEMQKQKHRLAPTVRHGSDGTCCAVGLGAELFGCANEGVFEYRKVAAALAIKDGYDLSCAFDDGFDIGGVDRAIKNVAKLLDVPL